MSDAERGGVFGAIRDKLIAKKQDWAREGRLLTGAHGAREVDRLPPGQRLVRDWPVLDLGVQPAIPRERFRLIVDGAVEAPVVLDWGGLMALPQSESISDIHCVTAWSRYDNRWSGVRAADLLAAVKPRTEARHVLFQSSDGYTTNVPLAAFADDDVMLAHSWDGAALDRRHGGPLRVVIPKLYFWKSAKWVRRITLAAEDQPGFWETRGYHNHGDPWMEERYG
ncbi:sulfite oxidase-like oxidoreductase [Elioraea sp.]|uniref:sulfite oxidase-like oxidoreductase n=1 Tax=Elioraea sp. TaxID=2185103 RepID=UPI003F718873